MCACVYLCAWVRGKESKHTCVQKRGWPCGLVLSSPSTAEQSRAERSPVLVGQDDVDDGAAVSALPHPLVVHLRTGAKCRVYDRKIRSESE